MAPLLTKASMHRIAASLFPKYKSASPLPVMSPSCQISGFRPEKAMESKASLFVALFRRDMTTWYDWDLKLKSGTADNFYKSETIDPFGDEYLPGIYETIEEGNKASAECNKAYEDTRAVRANEMEQLAKQEQPRIVREKGPGTEIIKEALKEARR
eukprot:TRINITY_DN17060_c0_g1_i14.p1 TRINITY_DN17060_c0_g1~~TRINITY_DN17060_c0_g1_i14.p1  ORF type:complete len:156 (-),score=35.97 TRINITY_DN17060_c0_g1_i14:16-483(-)